MHHVYSLQNESISSWRFTISVLVLGVVGLAPATRANLLLPGTRSGSVTAFATGSNSGPGPFPSITQTVSIPGSGAGNISAADYSTSFSNQGFGTPPSGVLGGFNSAAVNLNTISGNSYSLNASTNFGHATSGASGNVTISPSYTFDQQMIITQPVQYSLQLDATRPQFGLVRIPDVNGQVTQANLPEPTITFSGPGVSLSVSAPYPNGITTFSTPMTVSQTFSGTLQPGTYFFDSNFVTPQMYYLNGLSADNQTESVDASFTVVPEPASLALSFLSLGLLTIRRRRPRTVTA